ncbi:MAG: gfo/Idh/MocA family oxidoreductase, partial [Flavisolibacter sp.]
NPQLLSEINNSNAQKPNQQNYQDRQSNALQLFIDACKSGKQYPGNFLEAEHLTEAVNLYAVALRTGKLLKYDAATTSITNVPDANKYLNREYRTGWDPSII